MPPTHAALSRVTPRQQEILSLVAKGLRNQEIADVLGISLSTVKVHVAAILKAFEVSNRTEAVFEYQAALDDDEPDSNLRARVSESIGRPTLAVVPFDDQSSDGPALKLAAALHQDLVLRLSGWRWLPVLAPSVTQDIDPAAPDIPRLRDVLRARYVVTGQIQSAAGRYRIHAHLVDVASEQRIWSTRHEFSGEEVFGLQDSVSRAIVAQIAPDLIRAEGQLAERRETPAFDAWQLASQAMWHVNRAQRDDAARAIETAERAIALDANLVLGWYAIAAAHYQRLFHQWSDAPGEDLRGFHAAAQRCIDADARDAAAHEIFGFSRLVEGRHVDAITHLEHATRLNPSNAQAYSELGQALALNGHADEGIAHLEEALYLAPVGESAWSCYGGIAIAHFMADRPGEAAPFARRAISLDPDAPTIHALLAAILAADGQIQDAQRVLADLARIAPGFDLAGMLRMTRRSTPDYAARLERALAATGALEAGDA